MRAVRRALLGKALQVTSSRCWHSLIQPMAMSAMMYVLRAVGLDVVNSFSRRLSGPRKLERPKIVLHKSFWIALSRAAVHLLPQAVFVGLIYINYNGLYIGPSFEWTGQDDTVMLTVIQVAAKIQELLCAASLAAIVLQGLRRELLGDGVPIGLLGSGIWFSQISSFWSPGFIAAIPWSVKTIRRFQLYTLIMLAGGLAVLIGPMSAVLMLPRSQSVPAAGTSFYLNGATDDFWPETVTSTSALDICRLPNATEVAVCPSGGYHSILHVFKTWGNNYTSICGASDGVSGTTYAPQCQAKGILGWRQWKNFLIQSPQNMVPPVLSTFLLADTPAVVQPHAATVASAQQLVRKWTQMVDVSTQSSPWNEYKWSYALPATVSATNPWARVQCARAQVLTANATGAEFPYVYRYQGYRTMLSTDNRTFDIFSLNSAPSDQIRAQWLPLSIETFGDIESGLHTTGLLVELPWNGDSRLAFGCAATAAWHNNTVSSDRAANYGAWSADITGMEWTWHYPGLVESEQAVQTNRWITLDESWLGLLTPRLLENGLNLTTLENLLTQAGIASVISDLRTYPSMYWDVPTNKCIYGIRPTNQTDEELWNANDCGLQPHRTVELIVASVLSDGLSRYNSHLIYQNTNQDLYAWEPRGLQSFNSTYLFKTLPQTSSSSSNRPSQWLTIYVVGWAYYASTTTDYLALAIVCLYMAVAGVHVFWLLYWNHWESSGAWDTITELLVLCKNSPSAVPSKLENASAGIHQLSTHATLVKVRVEGKEDAFGEGKVILVEEGTGDGHSEEHYMMKCGMLKIMQCGTTLVPMWRGAVRPPKALPRKVELNARYS